MRPVIKMYPEMNASPLALADFYKPSHIGMRVEGNQFIYSNVTPRFNRHSKTNSDKVVVWGIQAMLKNWLINYWTKNFFNLPLEEAVSKFKDMMNETVGMGEVQEIEIRKLWTLGYLPLHIKAIEEGSRVNVGVPIITATNTVPGFGWLVQYIETLTQSELWKSITAATDVFAFRQMFNGWAEKTSSTPEFVDFQGHDFSFRGMDGVHSAIHSGMAHLLMFTGTDTMIAIEEQKRLYNASSAKGLIGTSVNAMEHAVMCEHIAHRMHFNGVNKERAEFETLRHFVTERFPSGIISVIADTNDYWQFVTDFLPQMKWEILNRSDDQFGNSCVTIRPDSSPSYSSPYHIITGFKTYDFGDLGFKHVSESDAITAEALGMGLGSEFWDFLDQKHEAVKINGRYFIYSSDINDFTITLEHEIPEYEAKGTIQVLWDIFGGITNDKGYKELDRHIRIIYGDSITYETANKICKRLAEMGFASTNWIAGIGSYFYQMTSRDSYGIAMKATAAIIDDVLLGLQKQPKTDPTKNSAIGFLRVDKVGDDYIVHQNQNAVGEDSGELKTVFLNSMLVEDVNFEDVRASLRSQL